MKSENRYEGMDPMVVRVARATARRMVRGKEFRQCELEDLEQDLMVTVWTKLRQYQPERSCLRTFVNVVTRVRALELRRCRRREMRNIPIGTSLDRECGEYGDLAPLHERIDHKATMTRMGRGDFDEIAACELAMDYESILASLTPQQKEICRLLLDHTHREIAGLLTIGRSTLYRELARIREAFRKASLELF